MPSLYTDNGGIELIGLGEKAGAWGTTTNNNFSIIDRLINGVTSIAISGNTTLTTSDGSLSQGMFKLIVFTGSLGSGATITISPPDAQKVYCIQNDTNQTLTFQQGGTSDTATVVNGEAGIIFADGGSGSAKVKNLSDNFNLTATPTFTTATVSTALVPDASGGADIGTADLEFGAIFIADDKFIKFGSDQDVTIGYDETTSDTLQIAGGDISIADDKKLFFGTDKDVSIEYDEDGTDTMLVTGDVTVTGNVTFSDGTTDVNVASHDGTNGLKLGGTLVTASATELNKLDGVTRTTAQINSARSGTVPSVSGGTGISVSSGTSTPSVSVNTGLGNVGTYAFLARKLGSYSTIVAGTTYSNSSSGSATVKNANLVYAGFLSEGDNNFDDDTALDATGSVTTGLNGVWRAMGEANGTNRLPATLFLRIS